MVSDFVDEHNGFLQLTDQEHEQAKRQSNDNWFLQYRSLGIQCRT